MDIYKNIYYPEFLARANSSAFSFLLSCFSSLLRLLRVGLLGSTFTGGLGTSDDLGTSGGSAGASGGSGGTAFGGVTTSWPSGILAGEATSVWGVVAAVAASLLPVVELFSPSSHGVTATIIHFVA